MNKILKRVNSVAQYLPIASAWSMAKPKAQRRAQACEPCGQHVGWQGTSIGKEFLDTPDSYRDCAKKYQRKIFFLLFVIATSRCLSG